MNETNEVNKTNARAHRSGKPTARCWATGLTMVQESRSGIRRRILAWLRRALPSLPPDVARALMRKIGPGAAIDLESHVSPLSLPWDLRPTEHLTSPTCWLQPLRGP
jgi:hypothetical protein